ncbi:hypothetical protein BESB_020820 [Besnoitia besnoiti]|uniref:Glutamic acid-rich protein n=1 Tax=Besnoitia besnoiti TaxID=94643 RepID=A0A2A9M759_BESBE|nr:hypothetical protein BESB_020820 [Besnoitia besnoiti]PFH32141.1 hypothetical protein BESB_020820 [Besnoitia besnoiti]
MSAISSFLKRKVKDRLSLLDAALEADTLLTRLKATLSRFFEGGGLPTSLPPAALASDASRPSPANAVTTSAPSPPSASPRASGDGAAKGRSADGDAAARAAPVAEARDADASKPCSSWSGRRKSSAAPQARSAPALVSPLPAEALEKLQQLLQQLLLLCRQQKASALQAAQKKIASASAAAADGLASGPPPAKAADDATPSAATLCSSLVTHPLGLRVLCGVLHLGKAYAEKTGSFAHAAAVSTILQDALEILDLLFAVNAPPPLTRVTRRGDSARGASGLCTPQRPEAANEKGAHVRGSQAGVLKEFLDACRCGDEEGLDATSSDEEGGDGDGDGEEEDDVDGPGRGTPSRSQNDGSSANRGNHDLLKRSDAADAWGGGVYLQLMDGVMQHTEYGDLIVSLLLLPEVYIQHDVLLVLQKLYGFAEEACRRGREALREQGEQAEKARQWELATRQQSSSEQPTSSWIPVRRAASRVTSKRDAWRGGSGRGEGQRCAKDVSELEARGAAVCRLLEDALLNRPACITRLTASLQEGAGATDFVREEALEVLRLITGRRQEMKVIATFQGAIEALLSLLASELGLPLGITETSFGSASSSAPESRGVEALQPPPLATTQLLLSAPRVRSSLRCLYSLTSCGPVCKHIREANLLRPLALLLQFLLRAKEDHVKQLGRLTRQQALRSEENATENSFPGSPPCAGLERGGARTNGAAKTQLPGVRTPPEPAPPFENAPGLETSSTPLDEALFLVLAVFGNFFPYRKKLGPSPASGAVAAASHGAFASSVGSLAARQKRELSRVSCEKGRRGKAQARWSEADIRANQAALLRSGLLDLLCQHVAKVWNSLAFFFDSHSQRPAAAPLAALVPSLFRLFTRQLQLLLALVVEEADGGSAAAQRGGGGAQARAAESSSLALQALLLPSTPLHLLPYEARARQDASRAEAAGPPPFYCLAFAALQAGAPPALHALLLEALDVIITSFPAVQAHILEGCLAALGAASSAAVASGSAREVATPAPAADLACALPRIFEFSSAAPDEGGAARGLESARGDAGDEPPPLQILPPGVVLAAALQWAFRRAVRAAETAAVVAAPAPQSEENDPEAKKRLAWRWTQACTAVSLLSLSLFQNPSLALVACSRPLPSVAAGPGAQGEEPLLRQVVGGLLPALSRALRQQEPTASVCPAEMRALRLFSARVSVLLLSLLLPRVCGDAWALASPAAKAASHARASRGREPPGNPSHAASAAAASRLQHPEGTVALALAWLLSSALVLPSLLLLLPFCPSARAAGTPSGVADGEALLRASVALLLDRTASALQAFAETERELTRDIARGRLRGRGEDERSLVPEGGRQGRGMARADAALNLVAEVRHELPSLEVYFSDLEAGNGQEVWRAAAPTCGGGESSGGDETEKEGGSAQRKDGRRDMKLGNRGAVSHRADETQRLLVQVVGVECLALHAQRLQTDPGFRFASTLVLFPSPFAATAVGSRGWRRHPSSSGLSSSPGLIGEVDVAARVPASLYVQALAEVGLRQGGEGSQSIAEEKWCNGGGAHPAAASASASCVVAAQDSLEKSPLRCGSAPSLGAASHLARLLAGFLLPREVEILRLAATGSGARGLQMLLAVAGKRACREGGSYRGSEEKPDGGTRDESQQVDCFTREDFEDFLLFQEDSIAELRRENARLAARTARLQEALDPDREALLAQLQRETSLLQREFERLLMQKSALGEQLAGERRLAAAQLADTQKQLEAVVLAFSQLEEELQTRESELQTLRAELHAAKSANDWRRGGRAAEGEGEDEADKALMDRLSREAALAARRGEQLRDLQEKHNELLALLDLLVHRVPECLQFVCSLSDLPCRYSRELQALASQVETASRSACLDSAAPRASLAGAASSLGSKADGLRPAEETRQQGERATSRGLSPDSAACAASLCSRSPFPLLPEEAGSDGALGVENDARRVRWTSDEAFSPSRGGATASGFDESDLCHGDAGAASPFEGAEDVAEAVREDSSYSRLSCQSGASSSSFPPSHRHGAFSESTPQETSPRDTPTQIPTASLSSSSPSPSSPSAFAQAAFSPPAACAFPLSQPAATARERRQSGGSVASLALVGRVLSSQQRSAEGPACERTLSLSAGSGASTAAAAAPAEPRVESASSHEAAERVREEEDRLRALAGAPHAEGDSLVAGDAAQTQAAGASLSGPEASLEDGDARVQGSGAWRPGEASLPVAYPQDGGGERGEADGHPGAWNPRQARELGTAVEDATGALAKPQRRHEAEAQLAQTAAESRGPEGAAESGVSQEPAGRLGFRGRLSRFFWSSSRAGQEDSEVRAAPSAVPDPREKLGTAAAGAQGSQDAFTEFSSRTEQEDRVGRDLLMGGDPGRPAHFGYCGPLGESPSPSGVAFQAGSEEGRGDHSERRDLSERPADALEWEVETSQALSRAGVQAPALSSLPLTAGEASVSTAREAASALLAGTPQPVEGGRASQVEPGSAAAGPTGGAEREREELREAGGPPVEEVQQGVASEGAVGQEGDAEPQAAAGVMMSFEEYVAMLQAVDESQLTLQQLEEWRAYRAQCEAFFAYQRQYAQWQER